MQILSSSGTGGEVWVQLLGNGLRIVACLSIM